MDTILLYKNEKDYIINGVKIMPSFFYKIFETLFQVYHHAASL
jgi:hypothetical protein